MRISDWSSDVCSSDLAQHDAARGAAGGRGRGAGRQPRPSANTGCGRRRGNVRRAGPRGNRGRTGAQQRRACAGGRRVGVVAAGAVPAAGPARDPAGLMHWWHRLPLNVVYAALTIGYMLVASALSLLLLRWLQPWAAVLVAVALPLPLLLYHVRRDRKCTRLKYS